LASAEKNKISRAILDCLEWSALSRKNHSRVANGFNVLGVFENPDEIPEHKQKFSVHVQVE
jgi:hypothetical protein